MRIEKKQISDLNPAPYNPRKASPEQEAQLKRSLEKFGAVEPVVWNEQTGNIVGGHFRVRELKKLGYKEIECVVVDLNQEDEKELNIRLNANTGSFDWEVLQEWDVEQLEDWGLEVPNEKRKDVDAEDDDFDVVLPQEPKTVLGDVYEIGNHRLICGDSTQTDTFENLMSGDLADLVVTDPPYNVAYEGATKEKLTIQNDNMSNDDFYKFLYDFYVAQNSFVKKGGVWYVWHADSEGMNFRKAMLDAGILLKQNLIWIKNTFVMGRQDYQWKHEPCLYGWKEGGAHFWKGGRKQSTILEFDKPLRNGDHPTMKPIPLFGKLIKNSSKIGDIVCDSFGGSGTTMVACHQMKRRARVVEFDPKYCDVIVKRMITLDPTLTIKRNGVDVTSEFKSSLETV